MAGPVEGDLVACSQVNKTSCDAIILEDCDYSGTRLGKGRREKGSTFIISDCYLYTPNMAEKYMKTSWTE